MSVINLISKLNNEQKEVVLYKENNLLVIAGAGSGKTKVLSYRIAWLISNKHYSPNSIMAVTFSNKAANEMKFRIKKLVGSNSHKMWIGTFHSLAYRLLRKHYIDAKLKRNFQIIDNEDQLNIIKNIIRDMNLDKKKWLPNKILYFINKNKDFGLRPKDINKLYDCKNSWQNIYQCYQDKCNNYGLLDFSEILLKINELFTNNPRILDIYRKKFNTILVDEFQDTNKMQYEFIRILSNNNTMLVGDDDQSIYGWRGARIENIKNFLKDFYNVKIIRLEQNYRSTNNILTAANVLISNNRNRLVKNLWTSYKDGDLIDLYCSSNELDEAYFVAYCVKLIKKNGGMYQDCAILYRNNYQSRILEDVFIKSKIPYNIYGGMRFFERKEIKDVLSYLRIIIDRNDNLAFERIINIPPRGIGKATIGIIKEYAKKEKKSFWQISLFLISNNILSNRYICKLKNFLKLIDNLSKDIIELPLYLKIDLVIKKSGLWDMYKLENNVIQSRIDNLKELVNSAQYFIHEDNYSSLQSFLSQFLLDFNEYSFTKDKDAVQFMTLHSSKGLEFNQVFIIGMEEGIFPNQLSLKKEKEIEEERRLAYVGITRAIKKLTITYSKNRKLYGKNVYCYPSRFIAELPQSCVKLITY